MVEKKTTPFGKAASKSKETTCNSHIIYMFYINYIKLIIFYITMIFISYTLYIFYMLYILNRVYIKHVIYIIHSTYYINILYIYIYIFKISNSNHKIIKMLSQLLLPTNLNNEVRGCK